MKLAAPTAGMALIGVEFVYSPLLGADFLKSANSGALVQQQPQSIRPDALEPPREIGLDRMIARVVRELTDIGNADLHLRAQLQITTRFDECGVACDRDAQDAERRTGVLERKQRAWRHVPKACCHASDARGINIMPFGMR